MFGGGLKKINALLFQCKYITTGKYFKILTKTGKNSTSYLFIYPRPKPNSIRFELIHFYPK